jgi:hypothetical protein
MNLHLFSILDFNLLAIVCPEIEKIQCRFPDDGGKKILQSLTDRDRKKERIRSRKVE